MTEKKHGDIKEHADGTGDDVSAFNPNAKNFLQGFIAGVTAAEHPQPSTEKKEEETK